MSAPSPAFGEAPLRPLARRGATTAAKRDRSALVKAHDARALDRYRIARFVLEHADRLSVRELEVLVRSRFGREIAVEALEHPPTRSTISRWIARAREKAARGQPLTALDFTEAPRSGRTPLDLHPHVQQVLENMLLERPTLPAPALLQALKTFAADHQLPPPTGAQVRAVRREFEPILLSAAAHGRRAGVVDGGLKLTVPTRRPHETWVLDELEVPRWFKTVNPITGALQSIKTQALFVMDHFSHACLGYYVFPPYQDSAGTKGFSSDDVRGAFLTAVLPAVAPEATREFSGYLPETLRMDNHPTHVELRDWLLAHDVDVPELPSRMPHARGLIERFVYTIKQQCRDLVGYEGEWMPTDRFTSHPRTQRTAAAGSLLRHRRRRLVTVEDLPTFAQVVEDMGRAVMVYNRTVNRMLQRTPREQYHNNLLPRDHRSGLDALLWLDVTSLTVQTKGLEHRNRVFAALDPQGHALPLRSIVACRIEPLNRVLYVTLAGVPTALRPVEDVARDINPGVFARERADLAAAASRLAEEAQRVTADRVVGPNATRRADADLDDRLATKAERKARRIAERLEQERRRAERLRRKADRTRRRIGSALTDRGLGAAGAPDGGSADDRLALVAPGTDVHGSGTSTSRASASADRHETVHVRGDAGAGADGTPARHAAGVASEAATSRPALITTDSSGTASGSPGSARGTRPRGSAGRPAHVEPDAAPAAHDAPMADALAVSSAAMHARAGAAPPPDAAASSDACAPPIGVLPSGRDEVTPVAAAPGPRAPLGTRPLPRGIKRRPAE